MYQAKLCFQLCKQKCLSSVSAAVPWSYLLCEILCCLYIALCGFGLFQDTLQHQKGQKKSFPCCWIQTSGICHFCSSPLYHRYLFSWQLECIMFAKPFVSLWIWMHFLVDKLCVRKKLILAAGVLQDQLLLSSFFMVGCTWQITLKSCFHNLLCLVILPTAVIFVTVPSNSNHSMIRKKKS